MKLLTDVPFTRGSFLGGAKEGTGRLNRAQWELFFNFVCGGSAFFFPFLFLALVVLVVSIFLLISLPLFVCCIISFFP